MSKTKMSIPIYKSEEKDGLSSAIASCQSIAYFSKVCESKDVLKERQLSLAKCGDDEKTKSDAFIDTLYPIHTILVTTGWNKNDDVFVKEETWSSRNTPEDKPFNIEHQPRKIIGHITSNTVVDEDYNPIEDENKLPNKFHILTGAVVYKHLNSLDKDLEKESEELVKGISEGKWYVSMECLFTDFDYAIKTSDGLQMIVPRDENTSHLTKHLRIYGGTGEYNNMKVGRVLRNITFSGNGLVSNPANPESFIFNDMEVFEATVAGTINTITIGDEIMASDNDKYVVELEKRVEAMKAEIETANKKIEELGSKNVQASIKEKDEEITKLNEKISSFASELETANTEKEELAKAKEQLEQDSAKAKEELEKANTLLANMEAQAKATSRISTLVDKGVAKEEAEIVVAEFSDLSDEKFEKIVAMKVELSTKANKEIKEDDEDIESDKKGETVASQVDLDNAKPEDNITMASDENKEDENKDFMQSMASYMDAVLHGDKEEKN